MPFIKKSLFDLKNTSITTIDGYEKYLKDYPKSLIKIPRAINKKIPPNIKLMIFSFMSDLPFVIRKLFAIIIGKCFSFIQD